MTWDRVRTQHIVLRSVVCRQSQASQEMSNTDQSLKQIRDFRGVYVGAKDCILLGMGSSVRDVCQVIKQVNRLVDSFVHMKLLQ